jgi:hypothetical protein
MITTTAISGATTDLVQQLFRKADTNGDGHVSATEFKAFMTNALATPGGRSAFMALAQQVPATPANLQQIAAQLGPAVGHIEADGKTFDLAGGNGAVSIRDLGHGPVWQWTPATPAVAR